MTATADLLADELDIDLFAGPGGWEVAEQTLGRRCIGVEMDASACATRAAAGLLTIRADVAAFPCEHLAGLVAGLIASPPCQAFSKAGKRQGIRDQPRLFTHIRACTGGWVDVDPDGWHDERSRLVLEVLRWTWSIRPRWIACEQVEDAAPLWSAMCDVLDVWGYATWSGVLHAEQYGVPQTRSRAILMASRDRAALTPPPATHQEYVAGVPALTHPQPDLFGGPELLPWVSMAQALGFGLTGRPFLTVAPGKGPNEIVGGSGARAAIAREVEGGGWMNRPEPS